MNAFGKKIIPNCFFFLSSFVIPKTGSGGHLSSLRNILWCKSMPFVCFF